MRSRIRRLVLVSFLAIGAVGATASSAAADHCGADGRVSPASGPAGTTFSIWPDLGGPTVLELYHGDSLVRSVTLTGNDGMPRYRIRTSAGDEGTWTARSHLLRSECASDVEFSVTGLPDTATAGLGAGSETSPWWLIPFAPLALSAGFVIVKHRRSA